MRELEKRGIGRPSTYAAIISTIQDRGYVTLNARRFYAEKIGELVTDRLVENFDNLLDFGFTAQLERELDQIADGEADWRAVLDTFYGDFSGKLTRAQAEQGRHAPQRADQHGHPVRAVAAGRCRFVPAAPVCFSVVRATRCRRRSAARTHST